MELIATLEGEPRGVYCGAVGVLRPGGDATFNVAIRTMTIDAGTRAARFPVGGGIVWDSRAGEEYDEALLKARVLGG
jgi:para-aminobenzoate synthetase/4-amino-4-deoxychorismate lyase